LDVLDDRLLYGDGAPGPLFYPKDWLRYLIGRKMGILSFG